VKFTRIIIGASFAAVIVATPLLAQKPAKPNEGSRALQEREKAMRELALDGKRLLNGLKGLTREQRNAVIALMAITRASAFYESRFLKRDDASLQAFYGPLGQFSPAYRAPATFHQQIIRTCFDATVSCLSAQKKCRNSGGSDDQCDRDFRVIEACANEAACMTREFIRLHQGIPHILGGRDPWPPQPFPY
jgi:hypothetical protein